MTLASEVSLNLTRKGLILSQEVNQEQSSLSLLLTFPELLKLVERFVQYREVPDFLYRGDGQAHEDFTEIGSIEIQFLGRRII